MKKTLALKLFEPLDPPNVHTMTQHALEFSDKLNLTFVSLLGFQFDQK